MNALPNPNRNDIEYYGCVRCQINHFEDELLFDQHIGNQSKHGVKTMSYQVLLEQREARMHERDLKLHRIYNLTAETR